MQRSKWCVCVCITFYRCHFSGCKHLQCTQMNSLYLLTDFHRPGPRSYHENHAMSKCLYDTYWWSYHIRHFICHNWTFKHYSINRFTYIVGNWAQRRRSTVYNTDMTEAVINVSVLVTSRQWSSVGNARKNQRKAYRERFRVGSRNRQ